MVGKKIYYFYFLTQSGNDFRNLRIHSPHIFFQPMFLKSFHCGHREDSVTHKGIRNQSNIKTLAVLMRTDL